MLKSDFPDHELVLDLEEVKLVRCRAFPGRARGRGSKTYELLGIHPGADFARAGGNARETGGRSGIGHGEGIRHHHEGVAKTAYHPLVAVFTIFDAARKHGVNDQARAAYDASVASYRQTVLTAFQPAGRQSCGFKVLEQEAGVEAIAGAIRAALARSFE